MCLVRYCTFASQVNRFTNNIDGIKDQILFLINLFVSLGFASCKLIMTFTNCIIVINLVKSLKLLAIFFLLYLFNFFKCLCVIVNKFNAWCDISIFNTTIL